MTPAACHPDRVHSAASWLATLPYAKRPHPLIPALRARFELTPAQAVEAIREAQLIRVRAM